MVLPVLTKLGILDAVKSEAYLNREGVTWRDMNGNRLANLPVADKGTEFGGVLLLGQVSSGVPSAYLQARLTPCQYKLAMIILEELKKYPCVEVCFGLRCGGIEDQPQSDAVKLLALSKKIDAPETLIEAQYVLGTDGANSAVRRMLCIPFEGFTYTGWKMIGTDVLYDFTAEQGYTPLNFIVHPEASVHLSPVLETSTDQI